MFAYEIGQTLVHRTSLIVPVPDSKETGRLFVLERMSQECPGGVQLHYKCRQVSPYGKIEGDPVILLEQEVAPWEEYVAVQPADLMSELKREISSVGKTLRDPSLAFGDRKEE